jgi:hypothetical protein
MARLPKEISMSIAASVRGGAISALAASLIVLGSVSATAADPVERPHGGHHCRPGQNQAAGAVAAGRCVRGQSRRHTPHADTSAPQTTITDGPSGTIATSTATFSSTSSEPSSSFECRFDSVSWQSCASPKAYYGIANGGHSFDVRAIDSAGNYDPSPATRTFAVEVQSPDTAPPETTITAGPSGIVTSASASFDFASSEAGSRFECRLDAGAWGACTSPKAYSGLANGAHSFDVRAIDSAGNTDASPATRSFTVDVPAPDTTPPETTITAGPSGTVTSASVSFSFASSEAGSSFQCRLDAGTWGACASPKAYSGLANGAHAFDVRATDSAGNTDASPASRSFTVDVAPSGGCQPSLSQLVAPGCTVLKSDIGATSNGASLWGNVECATSTRAQLQGSGGDTHPTAAGTSQGNAAFWGLSVVDGDDFAGERCELGRNEWRYGTSSTSGTFMLYPEGAHRITFASYRFPGSFPFMTSNWQTILQMKQAQPSNNGGGSPILEVQLRSGRLYLESATDSYWSTPVTAGVWERIALDVNYSQDPSRGSVTMYVDANGDGDAADAGEASPTIHTATLKPEIAGSLNGIAPGASIPSHLRVGLYHDPSIPCPSGCAVDVDNVQVVDL